MRLRVNGQREPLRRALAECVPRRHREAERAGCLGRPADDAGPRVELQLARELPARDRERPRRLTALRAQRRSSTRSPTVAVRRRVVTRSSARATVIATSAVPTRPSASVARIDSAYEPAVVGLPTSAPVAGSSVSPDGIVPPDTAHVYGERPPVAVAGVARNALPTMPVGSLPAAAATANGATTASVYCLVVERSGRKPSVSPTLTVNVDVPTVAGVPEIVVLPGEPSGASRQPGRERAGTDLPAHAKRAVADHRERGRVRTCRPPR